MSTEAGSPVNLPVAAQKSQRSDQHRQNEQDTWQGRSVQQSLLTSIDQQILLVLKVLQNSYSFLFPKKQCKWP